MSKKPKLRYTSNEMLMYIDKFLATEDIDTLSTPFYFRKGIAQNRATRRAANKEISVHYSRILQLELKFQKTIEDEGFDSYDTIFDNFNNAYQLYCKELVDLKLLKYTIVDIEYFANLYKSAAHQTNFNNSFKKRLMDYYKS